MPKSKPLSTPSHSAKPNALFAWTALLAVGLIAYSTSFRGQFVLDDLTNILNNPYMEAAQLHYPALRDAVFEGPSSRRPVSKLTLALNYCAGGDHVWGYHAVNLAIHLACGGMVYLIGLAMFRSVGLDERQAFWAALTAALVFVSHPIQISAVTYIVQRMTSLAAMFYLAALLLYIHGRDSGNARRRKWLWGAAGLCWLLSLGSKENAVTLPLAIWLYEAYFIRKLDPQYLKRSLKIFIPVCGIIALVIFATPAVREMVIGGYEARSFTLGERVLTQFRVVALYLSLLVWPAPGRFCLTHDMAVSHGWFDPPTTLACFFLLAGLVVLGMFTAQRWPVVSFGIFWTLLHLGLESSIIPLELAYEHRMYLPMAGIAWAAAWALFHWVRDWRWAGTIAAVVVMLLTAFTYERNMVWWNSDSLWKDVLVKYPENARAYNNLGSTQVLRGNLGEGRRYFEMALSRDDKYPDAHYNLATVLDAQGQVDAAVASYERAIELKPDFFQAHNNLGNKRAQQGQLDDAIEHFKIALKYGHRFAVAHNNLGNALNLRGEYEDAIAEYRKAIKIDPVYAQAHFGLANVLASQGMRSDAIEEYRQALSAATKLGNRPLAESIRARLASYE